MTKVLGSPLTTRLTLKYCKLRFDFDAKFITQDLRDCNFIAGINGTFLSDCNLLI